ncbi:hypothetical protein B296_00023519 [Ensete ventricosum]|uniref:Uncharacterized protein n=1 Tax=Ensete ventricosum TaxID=4639 RepID=A0A426Z8A5_ENSVE|nr:hypothetical protein B296_00023519 [Ensete ventricosum]
MSEASQHVRFVFLRRVEVGASVPEVIKKCHRHENEVRWHHLDSHSRTHPQLGLDCPALAVEPSSYQVERIRWWWWVTAAIPPGPFPITVALSSSTVPLVSALPPTHHASSQAVRFELLLRAEMGLSCPF